MHIIKHDVSSLPLWWFTGDYHEGTVYVEGNVVRFVNSMDKEGTSYGFFNNSIQDNGWGILEVKGGYGNATKNRDILYSAGYLEGVLTAKLVLTLRMRSYSLVLFFHYIFYKKTV